MFAHSRFGETLANLPFAALGGLGFCVGAIVGSFVAVVLIRWPRGGSALRGRSRCDGCGAQLGFAELVPILSFVGSRGRCRRCGAAIDSRHLLIELSCAVLGLVALVAIPGVGGVVAALLGWWLLLLAALDAQHHWLPDKLSLPLIPTGLAVAALGIGPALDQRLIGAMLGFSALWAIGWSYRLLRGREGLGGGDPKLLAGLGAWLGWQQLPLVLVGAGLVGVTSLLLARSRGRRISAADRLPLGALLAVAAWPLWLVAAR